jgi:hypothetical protein
MDWFVKKISEDPLNANLHLQYALEASKKGMAYLAYAELKTADYLGADRREIESHIKMFRAATPKQEYMNHNQYFRFFSLSSEIISRGNKSSKSKLSILDIGGGQGELASFIPECSYCLVEPTINGISGTDLPFPDGSFDYVVSCHVLEHIPMDKRRLFLDQLLSKSLQGVMLLNPFYIEGTYIDERLRLFIEITGAPWAREHLECTLPRLEDILNYAKEKGLCVSVKPNGNITTAAALVFMDYFASKAGMQKQLSIVNHFFNTKYIDILDSADYPVAYLVYIGFPETEEKIEQGTSSHF